MGILSNNKTDPYYINPNWFGNYYVLTEFEGNIELFFDKDILINLGERWDDDFNLVGDCTNDIKNKCLMALNNIICHTEVSNQHSNKSSLFLSSIRNYTESAINSIARYTLEKWDWVVHEEELKWYRPVNYLEKSWLELSDIEMLATNIFLYDHIKISIITKDNECFSMIYYKRTSK